MSWSSPPSPDSSPHRPVLALLAAATAIRLLFAWGFLGFVSGDDVEILETALRSSHQLDYQPYAIRSLFLPEVVLAPALELSALLGIESPVTLVRVALAVFVGLGTLGVWLLYRLTVVWLDDRRAALLAACLYASHPLFLSFGSTSLPRVASTTAILAAVVMMASPGRDLMRGAASGALVALAFACRYSEAIFLAPLLLVAATSSEDHRALGRRAAGLTAGFLAGAMLAVGLYDLWSWGRPFASLASFAHYTLIEKNASTPVATQPALFYLSRLPRWIPLVSLPLLAYARGFRSAVAAWGLAVLPVVALSAIGHKDLRYLQGVLPFVALLAAAGALVLWRSDRRRIVAVLVTATLLMGLWSGTRKALGKSLAAVTAARSLTTDHSVSAIALTQAWAWGDRIFLGNGVAIEAIPRPSDPTLLSELLPSTQVIGLYREDLAADSRLGEVLAAHGFVERRSFEAGLSDPVVLYAARQPEGP